MAVILGVGICVLGVLLYIVSRSVVFSGRRAEDLPPGQ
jgi:hypothetical protein